MRWLSELSVRRSVLAWVLILSLTFLGSFFYRRLNVERSTLGHAETQELVSNFEASFSDGADAVELVCDMFIIEGVIGMGENSVAFALADVKDPFITGV